MLHQLPIGVLYYLDEGRDCRYSAEIISAAASKAARVLVLRPGSLGDNAIVQRRGQRRYTLTIEGKPQRIGQKRKSPEAILWFSKKIGEMSSLTSKKERIALSVSNLKTESFPMLLPHRIVTTVVLSYHDSKLADATEKAMKDLLKQNGFKCNIEKISDRLPMKEQANNLQLLKVLADVAKKWEIPLAKESSVVPSAGGLVPAKIPVVCGIGPVAKELYTPQEAVNRISLVQRTLLIAEFLAQDIQSGKRS
jgi:D-alanine-D-alanine ligase